LTDKLPAYRGREERDPEVVSKNDDVVGKVFSRVCVCSSGPPLIVDSSYEHEPAYNVFTKASKV
jgi:hypothetical protein